MRSDANANTPAPQWTRAQQQFLDLLQSEENHGLSKLELCRKAGFAFAGPWYHAIKCPEFREAVKALDAEAKRNKDRVHAQVSLEPPQWSDAQQRFLNLLQSEENRQLTRLELCRKAGFTNHGPWYRAIEDVRFRRALQELGVEVMRGKPNGEAEATMQGPQWGKAHQRFLEVLQVPENRQLNIVDLCQKAGYEKKAWYRALEHPQFKEAVEALGVEIERTGINAKPREPKVGPTWRSLHQTLLDLLQIEENRLLSLTDLCQKAGFSLSYWYRALEHPQFKAAVESLGVEIERHEMSAKGPTKAEQKILQVLQDEANQQLPIVQICERAGYSDDFWYKALESEYFVQNLEALGVKIKRREYNENGWTEVQQNILDVLQAPTNQRLSITEICQKAGYPNCTYWFRALKSRRFVAAIEAVGMEIWWNGRNANGFTRAQQRFLDFLQQTPSITAGELCRQLGYSSTSSWTEVLQDERFVAALEAYGIQVERVERRKDGWTWGQKRLLEVLQDEANRDLPLIQVCQLAGYSYGLWYCALQRPEVLAAIKNLHVRVRRLGPDEDGWTRAQSRLLNVLQDETNRKLSIPEVCEKAGYSALDRWYESLASEQFVQILEDWGVPIVRQNPPFEPHINVRLTMTLDEDLNQDVWDMRRFKPDYPKHRHPGQYILDFTWIQNPALRQQIKRYLRRQLPRWRAGTFAPQLARLKSVLIHLPINADLETIKRFHIEAILPEILALHSDVWVKSSLGAVSAMLNYMVHSPAWDGPRPPKDLIFREDIPSPATPLPRPIPPDVLDQLDPLLDQAIQAIINGSEPPILEPIFWDAIRILRSTGMRFADLAHLKAPNARNQGGCLVQDGGGDWWVQIRPEITKIGREHQIPTEPEDGVVDAILRQNERVKTVLDHFGESYLFRTEQGVLMYGAFCKALNKLSKYLTCAGEPYAISPHQFRHTIATDMIDNDVDPLAVKEFLGHASLTMTLRYIKV